ncbi:AraC family transcriptional regulator [Paenibacillus sp. GCM10023252]|uniref:AraC family transcriptional regulator n=1 Tax=Paenibacillus sp. GCM10023252 TaxID=3252649 RepID=UPI0036078A24
MGFSYKNESHQSTPNMDLKLYYCGTECCTPRHSWGPAMKDHFKIHFIQKGRGVFRSGDRTYHLSEGQCFLLCPDVVSYYEADEEEPWTYTWVAFNGLGAEAYLRRAGLSQEQPLYVVQDAEAMQASFNTIFQASKAGTSRDVQLVSALYAFLAELIEGADCNSVQTMRGTLPKDYYMNKVVEFIEINYSRSLAIAEIAEVVGLDRKYLARIFKEASGVSPQQYLIQFRVRKACQLLQETSLTISQIAYSVGYSNPLLFSKMFKQTQGLSPLAYRNNI